MIVLLAQVALAGTPLETLGIGGGGAAPSGPEAIINGVDATRDDYPMSGAILMDSHIQGYPYKAMTCSSTLIAPDVVMLAAHCVDPDALNQMTGGMPITISSFYWTRQADLSDYDGMNPNIAWPTDAVQIPNDADHVVFNDEFDINGMGLGVSSVNHDIALLFLSTPVTDVPFAYLPTVDEATQIVPDLQVEIVGWGQQTATSGQQQPPPGTYMIKEKAQSYLGEIGTAEMQVGRNANEGRKCHGDSGGPTFFDATTTAMMSMRVIGVTSHSYDFTDCASEGGVDTRVDAYLGWISREMQARCDAGTRVWCDETGIPALPFDVDNDGIVDSMDPHIGKGCGCASDGGAEGAGVGLVLAAMALVRRRRG